MIAPNTVLVLGAGASQPYGFPTGAKLRTTIAGAGDTPNDNRLWARLESAGYTWEEFSGFANALKRSGSLTVDDFWKYQQDKYLRVGKAAIAAAISECEQDHLLHRATVDGDWYSRLLHAWLPEARGLWPDHKLSIVTFNYDRSLERYLSVALSERFTDPTTEVRQIMRSRLEIVHVYGTLGTLPALVEDDAIGTEYNDTFDRRRAETALHSFHIVHESGNEKSQPTARARELLAAARRVLFLGVGYHRENLLRIGADKIPGNAAIYGSSYQLSSNGRRMATEVLASHAEIDPDGNDLPTFLDSNGLLSEFDLD